LFVGLVDLLKPCSCGGEVLVIIVCVCVCCRSSECYECFKSQSKVPTESTWRREQNRRRNWTKSSRFKSYANY